MKKHLLTLALGCACTISSSVSFASDWISASWTGIGRAVFFQSGGPYTGDCPYEFAVTQTDKALIFEYGFFGNKVNPSKYKLSQKHFELGVADAQGTQEVTFEGARIGFINNALKKLHLYIQNPGSNTRSLRILSAKYPNNPNDVDFELRVSGHQECNGTVQHN